MVTWKRGCKRSSARIVARPCCEWVILQIFCNFVGSFFATVATPLKSANVASEAMELLSTQNVSPFQKRLEFRRSQGPTEVCEKKFIGAWLVRIAQAPAATATGTPGVTWQSASKQPTRVFSYAAPATSQWPQRQLAAHVRSHRARLQNCKLWVSQRGLTEAVVVEYCTTDLDLGLPPDVCRRNRAQQFVCRNHFFLVRSQMVAAYHYIRIRGHRQTENTHPGICSTSIESPPSKQFDASVFVNF